MSDAKEKIAIAFSSPGAGRLLLILALFFFSFSGYTRAETPAEFELGVGGGINIDGLGSQQVLLIPALSWDIQTHELIRLRLEADLEIIDHKGHVDFVGGVAPFVRFFLTPRDVRPFVEIGAGGNLATSDHIGRKNVGGAFLFSIMAGAGMEIDKKITLSYRFHHLSNGGLYRFNESVNTQYLILSLFL